jgi:glycosyltransferase involved in cell wall biosynthesis
MTTRSIIQVTLWNSPYLGNFMASQLALAADVRERFGLGTHCVLGEGAEEQPWLEDLDTAGVSWSIAPSKVKASRELIDELVQKHSAALIHTHFSHSDLNGAAAASAAGIPCVWHLRTGFNGYPLAQRVKDLYKMRVIARGRVQQLIAVSPWLADLARRRGAPGERIEVVANAVDVERFAQLPDRAAARARFELDPGAQVVLLLGWWPEVKGVDILIDALAPIAERRPNVQALLVGEQDMRSFLAERLPVQPPWLRISGFVNDPAVLYSAADIFVSASRNEGQSGAVGEALASGPSVVLSDIAGNAVWKGAPNALGFPSEDVPALGERLERLLDISAEQRAAEGAENRDWVRGHLGMTSWSANICTLYERVLRDFPAS